MARTQSGKERRKPGNKKKKQKQQQAGGSGNSEKQTLANSALGWASSSWFPIVIVVLGVAIGLAWLPFLQSRQQAPKQLWVAVDSGDTVLVPSLLKAGAASSFDANPSLLYTRSSGASLLFTALRRAVQQREERLDGELVAHLHVPMPSQLHSERHSSIAVQLIEAGLGDAPVLRDTPRTAVVQAVIDRNLIVLKAALARWRQRDSAGSGEKGGPGAPYWGAAAVAQPWSSHWNQPAAFFDVRAEPSNELTTREHEFADALLVSVEGINHFMLFGTRELVTHGTSSPQFTAQEAAHLADTCNVVPGHASNRQVLCALRDTTMPILKALLADAPVAAVHAIDEYRQSAVHIAARYGDAAAIAALVAAGAPVNTATVDLKQSPLHRAVMAGWAAAVAALLDAGADVAAKDLFGRTAIDYAAMLRDSEMMDLLSSCATCTTAATARASKPQASAPARRDANDDSGDDGGWAEASATETLAPELARFGKDIASCDIASEDAAKLTPARFVEEYASIGRPVIVRGAAREWPLRRLWRRSELLERWGDVELGAGAIPHAQDFGLRIDLTTVEEFVTSLSHGQPSGRWSPVWRAHVNESEAQRVWKSGGPEQEASQAAANLTRLYVYYPQAADLMDDPATDMEWVPPFAATLDTQQPSASIALGDIGSGSPPHFHVSAWNALMHGRKRWWFTRPADAYFSRLPVGAWAAAAAAGAETLPGGAGLHKCLVEGEAEAVACSSQAVRRDRIHMQTCVQEPGDIVYIPEGIGHAVLNLAPSVAVSVEHDSPVYPHY